MVRACERATTLKLKKQNMLDVAVYIVICEIGGKYEDVLGLLVEAAEGNELPADIQPRTNIYTGTIIEKIDPSKSSVRTIDLIAWITKIKALKEAEQKATKYLQISPVANDLLKRYAAQQQEGKQNAPGAVMLDIGAADPQAKTMHEGEEFNTLENKDLTEDAEAEQEQEVDPADAKFAKLFPLAAPAALESMFPANGKWAAWALRAGRTELKLARRGRALFNPYLAAIWWLVTKKPEGWDNEKCLKVLAKNYPSETEDHHELLFPDKR